MNVIDERCRSEYVRPGGRQYGDRIVACHLPAGHPGEHEEEGTGSTWTNAPDPRPMEVTVVRFHPDGDRSARMWTVTDEQADQVAGLLVGLLGEPAMYQLTTGEERGTDG